MAWSKHLFMENAIRRIWGFSRDTFYRYQPAMAAGGVDALEEGKCGIFGPGWTLPDLALLANAEAAEDHPEQIIRRKLAGDARQLILRQPQLFRE